jgi:type I restriction enzyme, R subunit
LAKEARKNNGYNTNSGPHEASGEMLSPPILIGIIRNFLFFRDERGSITKVVCRYMQYRAANKIVERVLNSLSTDIEVKEKKEKRLNLALARIRQDLDYDLCCE